MSHHAFLEFPGEIRNQIYGELLILPPLSAARSLGDPPLYPQIIATCRRIRSEALQILYQGNTFLAHPNLLASLPRLRLYYNAITSRSIISMITRFHLRIRLDCDANFSKVHATESFTGLEEFTVEVFQAQFRSSGYKTLTKLEDVRAVKRVKIYGSTTAFQDYVEWLEQGMSSPRDAILKHFDVRIPYTKTFRRFHQAYS